MSLPIPNRRSPVTTSHTAGHSASAAPGRFLLLMLLTLFLASTARAQIHAEPRPAPAINPPILKEVGIDQNLGVQIPTHLAFRDESGRAVTLGEYFTGQRPIVLTLVYYKCPMLCTMVLNDVTRTMNGMPLAIGKDFDVLTVSFDPRETPELALKKKKQYLHTYHKKGADSENNWHFLTGDESSIAKLTDTVGFRYAWDPKFDQYAHASGFIILTPQGAVSKYFYGLDYNVKDMRLALIEAGGGKVGSPVEKVMLYCFHYDPSTGKYSLAITRLLKVAAGFMLVVLGTFWFVMVRRERRAKRQDTSGAADDAGGSAKASAPADTAWNSGR